METKEKPMSGEESLKIITEMITRTKANIRQGSFHLLFWGWLIFFCSLSEYLLYKLTDFSHPDYVKLFMSIFMFMLLNLNSTGTRIRVCINIYIRVYFFYVCYVFQMHHQQEKGNRSI